MVDRHIKVVESGDNVATAIRDVESGETVEIERGDEILTVEVTEDIRFGHKIALEDIPNGETVTKYGTSIGYASTNISAGEWVHAHNVDSNYGRGDLADAGAQVVSE